jgi:uncharacterized protein YegP (UPF0339 family)
MQFRIYKDRRGLYQWKLAGPNGEVARSTRGATREDCIKSIEVLKAGLGEATVIPTDSVVPAGAEAAPEIDGATRNAGNANVMRQAFEFVAIAVMQAGNDGVFLNRDVLSQRLLDSHLGPVFRARAERPGRDFGSPFAVAANYVDWFSSHITQGSELAASWGRRLRRVRISAYSETLQRRREIWAYSAVSPELRSEFLLRPNADGSISLGIVGKDDTWTSLDGVKQLDCGVYVVGFARWAAILAELEGLINDPHCTERMLQDFLGAHPTLLKGSEYASVIPEAVIHREASRIGVWEADFVLAPRDQEEFCRIVELKRPGLPVLREPRRGHAKFSQQLYDAVGQLRDYASAFDSRRTREIFQERYGVHVFAPSMQLVIGRRWDTSLDQDMKRFQEQHRVKVTSWDAELARLRRWLT